MSLLPPLIRDSGIFGLALLLLALVVLLLAVRAFWLLARKPEGAGGGPMGTGGGGPADAILFWGAASAVLGFLGQCQGTYLSLTAILAASELSPAVVAQGFVISFLPTLFGLGILAFSAVAWICLRFLQPGRRPPLGRTTEPARP